MAHLPLASQEQGCESVIYLSSINQLSPPLRWKANTWLFSTPPAKPLPLHSFLTISILSSTSLFSTAIVKPLSLFKFRSPSLTHETLPHSLSLYPQRVS